MDRTDRSVIALMGIMMAVSFLVNARAAETPNFNQASKKTDLKDSLSDRKSEMDQLVDLLLKNGDEFNFKEHIAAAIGLPGPMPSKVATVVKKERTVEHGFDSFARLCYLVYENPSEASAQGGKRPVCVYLRKHVVSGYDDADLYFRVNLDGRLEKVVTVQSKRDVDGKAVGGSAIPSEQDIESSESKKSFATEMAEMRKWLKAQRILLAKANATKPNEAAGSDHTQTAPATSPASVSTAP